MGQAEICRRKARRRLGEAVQGLGPRWGFLFLLPQHDRCLCWSLERLSLTDTACVCRSGFCFKRA